MVRQSGLGKGLGALIPAPPETGASVQQPSGVPGASAQQASQGASTAVVDLDPVGVPSTGLRELPIASIVPSRFQTREVFDEAALEELAGSIREVGVLQPILVRPSGNGTFELVAGERRWRAARRAGLDHIPALVRDTADASSVLHVLIENLQREDLDALEEAAGFQQLIAELGITHDEVAKRVGRSRSAVTNGLRLLQLTPSIQKLIKTRELSAGHARALLQVSDKGYQEQLAKRAVAEGMTVRQVEAAVALRQELAAGRSGKTGGTSSPARPATTKPAALLELEEMLGEQFATRVSIDLGQRNGKISIEFADIEDLERIFNLMTEPGASEATQTAP